MNLTIKKQDGITLALIALTCVLVTFFIPEFWSALWDIIRTGIHYLSIGVFVVSICFVAYIGYQQKEMEKRKHEEGQDQTTIVIPQGIVERIKLTLATSKIAWVVIGVIAFCVFTITKEAPAPIFRDANGNKIEQTIIRE